MRVCELFFRVLDVHHLTFSKLNFNNHAFAPAWCLPVEVIRAALDIFILNLKAYSKHRQLE